nr:AIR synthase-related protein [Bifidobacterium bifidum]
QDEYDLAGYATGVVDQDKMLTTALPKAGDVLIGLASSGIHSNGYSLVRQVLFKDNDVKLSDQPAELNGQTVGEAL